MPGREAWCPRCDEVRRARPGSACPTCSARLLRLPHTACAASWLNGPAAALQRVRSLLPALRALAAGAVVLALLAGAFVAGRSSSPAAAAGAAASTTAPTLTLPGGRSLSGTFREFGWRGDHGGLSLLLRTMVASGDNTTVTFEVSGLDPGWTVQGVSDLRVLDGQGRELALSGSASELPVFRSREPVEGVSLVTVSLQRYVDANAVARLSIGRLVLVRQLHEHLSGTLTDADLKRRVDQGKQDAAAVQAPASCPSCRVQVRCDGCESLRVAGVAYRHGRVTLLLAPTSPLAGGSQIYPDVTVSGDSGQVGVLNDTLEGGDTVVTFDGRELAALAGHGVNRMAFDVMATINNVRLAQGPWQVDQRSGSR